MTDRNCNCAEEHGNTAHRAKENMPTEENVERMTNTFRVLSEQSRLRIVSALLEGEMCVYHIQEVCGGTQSGVSHQLRILKDNRVIKSRREGQNVVYSIADEHIVKIVKLSREHLECKSEV